MTYAKKSMCLRQKKVQNLHFFAAALSSCVQVNGHVLANKKSSKVGQAKYGIDGPWG